MKFDGFDLTFPKIDESITTLLVQAILNGSGRALRQSCMQRQPSGA
jgi:hypothetical protein